MSFIYKQDKYFYQFKDIKFINAYTINKSNIFLEDWLMVVKDILHANSIDTNNIIT